MRYLGGKSRFASKLVTIMESYRRDGQVYLEPFMGSCAVVAKMSGVRIASDIDSDLAKLYVSLCSGWEPPETVTRDEYETFSKTRDTLEPSLRAFIKYGCSFGGKAWGGFAGSENDPRDYSSEARRNLLKLTKGLKGITFTSGDYAQWHPCNMLIYCDPPYANTTGYSEVVNFDTDVFWKTVCSWCDNNVVFVTEFSKPDWVKAEIVLELSRKSTLDKKAKNAKINVEKLFLLQAG